jgi:Tol biopolymer transport system component
MSSWRTLTVLALVAGCAAQTDEVPAHERDSELPVLQVIEGVYDGNSFSFRTLTQEELGDDVELSEIAGLEQPLVDIPSFGCSTCTGSDYVAFSNVQGARHAITNGAAVDGAALWTAATASTCGAVPTTGVCQRVRMRNLYSTQLERVYAELTQLSPTGSTTAVSIPVQPYGAPADFGLAAPAVANARWRGGEIGRLSPSTGGVTNWWAFTGTTPAGSNFTFTFRLQVRGQIVSATRRANLAGSDDPATNYPARTSGAARNLSQVGMSSNGRYVVFSTNAAALTGGRTNFNVVRHDMQTGDNLVVNMVDGGTTVAEGCIATDPSISEDGTRVTFLSEGCTLIGALGAPPAGLPQAYVRDLSANTTRLVSASTSAGYSNERAVSARISGNGQVVVFESRATNLVAGTPPVDANRARNCVEVYRRDLATNSTIHVSAIAGTALNSPSGFTPICNRFAPAGAKPDLERGGNRIVFQSFQPLEASDTNGDADIYVYRQGFGSADIYRISLSNAGAQLAAPTGFDWPAITPSGNFVAFSASASGVIGASSGKQLYRRQFGRTAHSSLVRVTVSPSGAVGAGGTGTDPLVPVLSESGRFVTFASSMTNLLSAATAGSRMFTCDLQATSTQLRRCFITGTAQMTPSSTFVSTVVGGGSRHALACPNENEACYLAYNTDCSGWTALANGSVQIAVSPVGDPRDQMTEPTP